MLSQPIAKLLQTATTPAESLRREGSPQRNNLLGNIITIIFQKIRINRIMPLREESITDLGPDGPFRKQLEILRSQKNLTVTERREGPVAEYHAREPRVDRPGDCNGDHGYMWARSEAPSDPPLARR